jgi:hypothetical protein
MKPHALSRLGWALAGLALGGAGGFFAGRQWPGAETGRNGRPAPLLTDHAIGTAANAGARSPLGNAAEATAGRQVLIPLGASPQQTLRNILAIPEPVDRLAALKEWCRTLPPDQVVAVLKEFQSMMAAQERVGDNDATSLFFQSVDVIAQTLFERGPEKVLAIFLGPAAEGEDADIRHGLGGEIFKKWAERDPAAARALLETRLGDPEKIGSTEKELSKHLMRAWMKTEPEAAMSWLLKQPKSIEEDAISPAFQALSHHDPDKALVMVAAQADLPGRDEIAATIAQWWAKTTPDKALAWAQGLPEKLAGPSVKKAMETWVGNDFAAAKQAMEGLSGPMRDAALPVMVEHWEKANWSEAAAYLDQQAGGKGRQEAVGQLIGNWAGGDQQAASAWLAKQAAGPERDAGAAALAEKVRDSDPEAAAIWGATLGDGAERQRSLQETFQTWYRKSVPDALRWLQNAPQITDSDRAFLMGGTGAGNPQK